MRAKLLAFPAALLARVEAKRLRIALLLAIALHLLPVLWVLGWPALLAKASDDAIQFEIETTTLSARPGGDVAAAERAAAERAAAERAAAERAAAERAAAEARAAAEVAALERALREMAEREMAERGSLPPIPTEPGRELTPRPPTAGPVERKVSGDPSALRKAAPGEGGEGSAEADGPGTLTAKFCEISPATRRIADIRECPSGPVQYFEYLNVPPRVFREGYPGFEATGRVEFFALFIDGQFDVSRPGRHYFRLTSDDGAQLFIDDQLVVDNDGNHPPITRDGEIELSSGRHRVRIVYFQGVRYELALQLFVTPPGEAERVFSSQL